METLGKRNNNPFNIRYSPLNKWKGLVGVNNGFCVFENIDYGVRAGIITLRTYILKHHLVHVEDIIKRFAPSSENNTSSYIRFVKYRLCSSGFEYDFISYFSNSFIELCVAIIFYESSLKVDYNYINSVINKFNLR